MRKTDESHLNVRSDDDGAVRVVHGDADRTLALWGREGLASQTLVQALPDFRILKSLLKFARQNS